MAAQNYVGVAADGVGKHVDAREVSKGDSGDANVHRQITEVDGPTLARLIELTTIMVQEITKLRVLAENELREQVTDTDARSTAFL